MLLLLRLLWFFFSVLCVLIRSYTPQRTPYPESYRSSLFWKCFQRGLCCFPGFSHPGAMSRKGKASQPLLAGMTGGSGGSSNGAKLPLFEAGTLLHGLISQSSGSGSSSVTATGSSAGNRPDDMMLLEKQGLCSQAQRQELVRGGSLPPSSLPKPKKHRKSSVTAKLGEYGRLSDSEMSGVTAVAATSKLSSGLRSRAESLSPAPPPKLLLRDSSPKKLGEYSRLTDERKTPTPTGTPPPGEKSRDSGIPQPRRFGEYRKMPENEKLQLPADMVGDGYGRSARESPRRYVQGGYDYGGGVIKVCDSPVLGGMGGSSGSISKARESPGRSMFIKWGGEYNKLKIADNERKLSTSLTEGLIKTRGSPMRSFIPSPSSRRGEYTCFTPSSMSASPQVEHKIGPNVESKLRIFSPGGMPGRRGSLQRECNKKEVTEGVRSLPTPNKYRIHF